jgi:uridine kinase
VAVSGIDGSGKGLVTAAIAAALEARSARVAAIGIDGWLDLPSRRFSPTDPAGHFYRRAIRFDELFDRLVLPLRVRRSVRIEADFAEETATTYRRHTYRRACRRRRPWRRTAIYFPAQEIHLERDDPRSAATAVIVNDPRLGAGRGGDGRHPAPIEGPRDRMPGMGRPRDRTARDRSAGACAACTNDQEPSGWQLE